MTLAQLLTSYVSEHPDLADCSRQALTYSLNNFRKFLGHEPVVEDLNKTTILAWMAWAGQKQSPRSVNHHRTNLLSLWNFAADLELIQPPRRIPKRKEPHREPVVWTLEDVQRLYSATDLLEGEWCGVPIRLAWKVALAVLYDTAARIGTLFQADLTEINLTTGQWHVPYNHLKGGRADRIFQLHADTISVIQDSLITPRKKLWPFPFGRRQLWFHWRKLLNLAGLQYDRHRGFHCLRRTAESYAAANMGIEFAAAAVGHSVEIARKHYISSTICKSPNLIDGLPRIF